MNGIFDGESAGEKAFAPIKNSLIRLKRPTKLLYMSPPQIPPQARIRLKMQYSAFSAQT